MSDYELTPLLTDKDEGESSEGGLDPLGTEPMADVLASRLAPGVRERQQHPRFPTAIAVSLSLCADLGEEAIGRDGLTEPWLVFEWYVVQGLVLMARRRPIDLRGLPGRLKAEQALRDNVPLSPKRYLKTPATAGFHGVYGVLAEALGIERDGLLGEQGYELLSLWSKEQGLAGFVGTGNGRGKQLREQLREALKDGLDQGAVARTKGWAGWRFFADHLAPRGPGRREAQYLREALLNDREGFRRDVLEFLTSPAGQRVWRREKSERAFHKELQKRASAELRRLLAAIDAYERFARLTQNAFDECLYEMTRRRGYVSATQLGHLEPVREASRLAGAAVREATERLEPFGLAAAFRERFGNLGEGGVPGQWVERLMAHHRLTQQQKPPNGKLPWFEGDERGYLIRLLYRRDEPAARTDAYVHHFRTGPLWSFAADLRMFRR
jgi:hypothetical protein